MENQKRVWTREEITNYINTSDEAVKRALLLLYNLQTRDEQAVEDTKYTNNVGFNKSDAFRPSSIADFYKTRKFLSPKQIALVRRRIQKYTDQLTKIANGQISSSIN